MSETTVLEPITETPEDRKHDAAVIRIAIADDHPIFLDGLKQILGLQPDFTVVAEARDGEEALQVIEEHHPDILLLDLRMPDKDGLAVLESLRASNDSKETPVVILSNYGERELVERGLKLGAREYLIKSQTTPARLSGGVEGWLKE